MNNKFKRGDKVVCLRTGLSNALEIGKVYTVETCWKKSLAVEELRASYPSHAYACANFKLVDETQLERDAVEQAIALLRKHVIGVGTMHSTCCVWLGDEGGIQTPEALLDELFPIVSEQERELASLINKLSSQLDEAKQQLTELKEK